MATSSQYRQLLSDYGPPSLGYTQEERQARARERDRLKKRRRREDGQRRSLERQRNILAMCRWRREKLEARRPLGQAWEQRQQQELEQALQRELAAWMQPRVSKAQEKEEEEGEEEELLHQGASLIRGTGSSQVPQSKYAELLAIIEELGKEIRPTYAGSKSAMERLKRGIIHARGLVRECLAETERNARS